MKMIMIAYNEAIDLEVMEILTQCGLKNYTKVTGVFGRGDTSGTHLGTDIWPGRNNLLYVAASDDDAARLMKSIRTLRKQYGREGIKAFVIPLEDVT